MNYINFSSRLPQSVLDRLDAEAGSQCRSRNQMILAILVERYKIDIQKSRPARPRASPARRKPKAKAAV